jgi:hypothetical protein
MSVTDEMLMAYADDELDAGARAQVEQAMRADRSIEQRVTQFREQRRLLQAAYAAELDEPVPEKVLATLRAAPAAAVVVDFPRAETRSRPRRASFRYTALAASILVAVGVGVIMWQRSLLIRHVGDAVLARGALARGLSEQLSGDDAGRVRVGLSFLAKSGAYCRTFEIRGGSPSAGLACRHGEQWNIDVLVHTPNEGESPYRTAGTDVPPDVLKAVEAEIAGEPLDRAGETAARAAHWRAAEPH